MNKGIYFAAFTALLWGFLPIALKVSLGGLPPVTVTWFRFSIAVLTLIIYYALTDRTVFKIYKRPPKLALIAGVFLGLNYIGFITGIHKTTPSIGQIFIQFGPVILALLGIFVFKEKLFWWQIIGLLIVLGGFILFYREQIIVIAGGITSYKKGVAWILFGALSWCGYAIVQKFAVRKYHPMQLNLVIFGLPALLYFPFVDFSTVSQLSVNDWLIIIFLGFNTLGAYGSLAFALKYLEANKISVIITLNPMITFTVIYFLSKMEVSWLAPETYSMASIIGALIVLTGVIITVVNPKK